MSSRDRADTLNEIRLTELRTFAGIVQAKYGILVPMKNEAENQRETLPEDQPIPADPHHHRDAAHVDVTVASPSEAGRQAKARPIRRKYRLPIILFVLTCASTFWVGVTGWRPIDTLTIAANQGSLLPVRVSILENWQQGLIYMACVLAILVLHELGHFIATILYRIPATAPIFIPFPFNPIGTLGAVIGMQGADADRKQIFDIGIAGPLAGLVVAVPIAIFGVGQLDLSAAGQGGLGFKMPLFLDWLIQSFGVEGYANQTIWINQLNPYLAAAWVGFLVTGLNMMPVGQLDGGHVMYTLFRNKAHFVAEAVIVFAIAWMVYYQHFVLIVMVSLLLIIGTQHPPTRDDSVSIGWFRWGLGLASLSIPFLFFPPMIFEIAY
ncbi:MAG: site-2 protease family protein [Pirellulaceae bacterium]